MKLMCLLAVAAACLALSVPAEQPSLPLPVPMSTQTGDEPMPAAPPDADAEPPAPDPQPLPDGASVFATRCAPCHGPEALGVPGAIPPLKSSDFLKQDLHRAVRGVLRGLQGEITVNGQTYNGAMPAHSHLEDAEIAAALTHVLSMSGVGEGVSAELVAEIRRESASDTEVTTGTCPRMAASGGACAMRAGGAGCAKRGGAGCGGAACPPGCCAAGTPRRYRQGRGW